ncbi:MAG TPA: 3-oxoadipate enol-lactonase [Solirubrobacteraceae bacterium]|nr:3-oxoadipate enol-lactonase [Solirubrobacteraceae bacterium]
MPAELRYEFRGKRGSPALVFSGSLGTDLTMWQPQADVLKPRFCTLRYDIRGHAASEVPPGPYSMDDLGSDLVALLDRLGIERASLCGLSIGGMISMWVAAHAPERVERLVLCCTAAKLGPPESWLERAAIVRADGVEAVADTVLERWFSPGFTQAHPEVIERFRSQLIATPPEGYAGCCEAIAAMDLTPVLPSISARTLVISAAEDPSTPPEHGRRIAELIPGARFELVPDARHIASVEQADLVTGLIQAFLDDHQR